MSKSYGNFISLSESDDSIRTKIRAMMTDPARKRRTDPGNPDVCPVFDWHKFFPEEQTAGEARARRSRQPGCRTAAIGCVECKGLMADALIEWIEPVRARREEYAADPDEVLEILDDGSAKARGVAQKDDGARARSGLRLGEDARAAVLPSRQYASATTNRAKEARAADDGHTLQHSSRRLRRPARPAARSDPQAGDGHSQHPHRHRSPASISTICTSSNSSTSMSPPISSTWPRR